MKTKIIIIIALLAVMLSMTGIAAACNHNNPPDPNDPDDCTFAPVIGNIVVDGLIGDWNTSDNSPDFYSDLYKKHDGQFTDDHYGKAYVKYCCKNGTLYVMVLLDDNKRIADNSANDQWIKLNGSIKVDGNDIINTAAPEFKYIYGTHEGHIVIIGWEASFKVAKDTIYNNFIIHVKARHMSLFSLYDDDCESTNLFLQCPSIPEFPTVAIPIAAMLGLVFFFQNKKRKEE